MKLSNDYIDVFWETVISTAELLNEKTIDLQKLRYEVSELPLDRQALFYHSEPIDIVRDVTGRFELSPKELFLYNNLRKNGAVFQLIMPLAIQSEDLSFPQSSSQLGEHTENAIILQSNENRLEYLKQVQLDFRMDEGRYIAKFEKMARDISELRKSRNIAKLTTILVGVNLIMLCVFNIYLWFNVDSIFEVIIENISK